MTFKGITAMIFIFFNLLTMGWFWANKNDNIDLKSLPPVPVASSGCPVKPAPPSACPIKQPISACPIDHTTINPLNNMPVDISSQKLPGQQIDLPTQRTISTIPKGDDGLWEYPSPQQMLNAMVRKNKGDVPIDAVESMVDVHNFLNEGAWQQILEWEESYTQNSRIEPRLLRFTGKPHDLSPRARSLLFLSKIFPNTFNNQPPFDRHDWTVLRSTGKRNEWDEVRYIIDYYSAPDDEETGMPAFVLDTRPALDSPSAALDRFNHWSGPIWRKAMGEAPIDD